MLYFFYDLYLFISLYFLKASFLKVFLLVFFIFAYLLYLRIYFEKRFLSLQFRPVAVFFSLNICLDTLIHYKFSYLLLFLLFFEDDKSSSKFLICSSLGLVSGLYLLINYV